MDSAKKEYLRACQSLLEENDIEIQYFVISYAKMSEASRLFLWKCIRTFMGEDLLHDIMKRDQQQKEEMEKNRGKEAKAKKIIPFPKNINTESC